MRIGFNAVLLEERISGITEHINNILSSILKIDKNNEYICYFSKLIKEKDLQFFKNAKCIKTNLTNNAYKRILIEQFYWSRQLIKDKIDIYHSPFFHLPLRISSKIKTVLTVHDLIAIKYPETVTKPRALFLKFAVSTSIKKADKIIALSSNTKKDIMELYNIPSDKIEVIYNGINNNYKIIKDLLELNRVREKLNLPEKYILFVGHLEPRKNIIRLIKAYNILREKFKIKEKLVIVGKENWFYQPIYDTVRRNKLENEVVFLNYVLKENMPYVYNCALLFVFPSLYEGFGLPPLEAMACGIPVVSSSNPPMSEVVDKSALLMNPYDINDMAEKIYQGLNDYNLRKNLIEKGFERIKLFNWDKFAEKTIKVYHSLIK